MKLCDDLCVQFGTKTVLEHLSIEIPDQGITALRGPSGCGKTTLLRVLARLATPDSGTLGDVSPKQCSLLFQEDRLLPWRSVAQQLTDVMPRTHREQALPLLELVELAEERDSFPSALSGGMGRRLALARCLALEADLYLLDEPFAGVDLPRAIRILERLRQWPAPILLVSHEPAILEQAHHTLSLDGPPLRIL